MASFLLRTLAKPFPVQRHEWPRVLVLLGVAVLIGMGFSTSRAASEALFLTRIGVAFLPYLLLANPLLILAFSTLYGLFADRLPNDRLLAYTALAPVPLILGLRLLIPLEAAGVYFALYALALSYATILATGWTVYLSGQYDVQEAKRLLPFISSGLLLGTLVGGLVVAACVPRIGAANVLLVWLACLLAVAAAVYGIRQCLAPLEAQRRKLQRPARRPGLLQHLKEGLAYSRTSPLFLTTAVVSIVTMAALQLLDFEYSTILSRAFPESGRLAAFLGIFDGLTTGAALLLQWFITPWSIRRLGVQGTNLLFPSILTASFAGLAVAPSLPSAVVARLTRTSLMPSLRGASRTLILNAVPRKMAARVRSFNTGIVMPLGQMSGALTLLLLKGVASAWLFPLLGLGLGAGCIYLSLRQNKAYAAALLELLREDKIHLLELDADELRQLDATAVAALSARLRSDQATLEHIASELPAEPQASMQALAQAQEEETLAAIELLRAIGSPHAFAALRDHLPYASPRLTAAALDALAAIGGAEAASVLRPYIDDPHPEVRVAAITGLQRLGDPTLAQRAATLLEDPEVQVRAAALAVILADARHPAQAQARQTLIAMLEAPDPATQRAALEVVPRAADPTLHGYLYRALDHPAAELRRQALRVLRQLAEAGRLTAPDAALLRALADDDPTSRELALQVLAALGSQAALESMLALLDDEQPQVREALVHALKPFGKRAVAPLLRVLQDPHRSLTAKKTALEALARLHGVQREQLRPFWEEALRHLYAYKLMLARLEAQPPGDADAFLRLALHNAIAQRLSLLLHLVAVWSSPQVAYLVESSLQDTDRYRRAQALEALENLSERRFTRLFLPILQAEDTREGTWQELARQQWQLAYRTLDEVLDACLQASDKWLVIGALLATHARTDVRDEAWRQRLQEFAAAADADIRHTAQRLLGQATAGPLRHLALSEAMLFLHRSALFRSLSLDQLRTVTAQLREREAAAGEVIFRQGDRSAELYLIVSGKVLIQHESNSGTHPLATLTAGDFFGDMAIFEDRPRSATALAVEPCLLLMLSPERFRQIIVQEPDIAFAIFRALSARLRRFDAEVAVTAG
ncbi:MAG: hypothetical protein KatS3mg131_3246 [Candidatus Tectimicrobiota bacterium]|nr:MAG: hypothetical protein KatS3mg131_3246 [Candidatus Tectomicrobia bacterium]